MAFGTDALEEPSGSAYDQTELLSDTREFDSTQGVHRKSTTFERDDKNVTTWNAHDRERGSPKAKSQPLPGKDQGHSFATCLNYLANPCFFVCNRCLLPQNVLVSKLLDREQVGREAGKGDGH